MSGAGFEEAQTRTWSTRVGRRVRSRQLRGFPDGPPLPAAVQLLLWARRPMWLMHTCRALYGDTYTLSFPGRERIVSLSDPEHVREVFTGPSEALSAGEANATLRPVLGDRSLLLLDGADHMRDRRLLLPPFHGERITRYGEVMRDVTFARSATWTRGASAAEVSLTLLPELQAITLDVILRTVFGLDEGPHMDEMRAAVHETTRAFSHPSLIMPSLHVDLGPRSPWGRFIRARARLDELLYAQIERRRASREEERQDVLTLLLSARDEDGAAMSDVELRDELVTLLLAGHETTATGLAWALHFLSTHPDVLERAVGEVDAALSDETLDVSAPMPFVEAVVKESLRLRPVITAVARVLQRPMRIGEWDLPAGTLVAPSVYLTHMNPKAWREPERFDPTRFLEGRISPYAFLAFGGGVRRCIGMAFALYEARVVLASLLARWTPHAAPGVRIEAERQNVTMPPSGGMPLVMRTRVG